MKCYRLKDNKILTGIQSGIFDEDGAPVSKGYINTADIELETDVKLGTYTSFATALAEGLQICYLYGCPWLSKVPKKDNKKGKILIAFDLSEYMPMPELGDASILLGVKTLYALYMCIPGKTFIMNRDKGSVVVLPKDKLEVLPASDVPKKMKDHRRNARLRRKRYSDETTVWDLSST
jgi:hypothetical protein